MREVVHGERRRLPAIALVNVKRCRQDSAIDRWVMRWASGVPSVHLVHKVPSALTTYVFGVSAGVW